MTIVKINNVQHCPIEISLAKLESQRPRDIARSREIQRHRGFFKSSRSSRRWETFRERQTSGSSLEIFGNIVKYLCILRWEKSQDLEISLDGAKVSPERYSQK